MEKHLCSVLALLLFLDFLDSLTLTVPEEVTGLLRKSVAIPCIFKPSAQYTNLEVTWYIDRYTIVIQRDKLALPSTKPTTSLISNPISALPFTGPPSRYILNEFTNRKIPVWVFVLTIVSIVLFFSATILFILYRSKTERDHKYEFTRTERFSLQEPVNLNSNENNEYEIMSKLDQLSIQNYKWDLPVDKHMLQFEEE
ncbi:uncharacterized protein [Narcine bancroftii]|uniref:uncharacterized protein isoform X4 n=1 Tax=Narcine bancroftii TaxID=1343680 RepID=UPI0038312447